MKPPSQLQSLLIAAIAFNGTGCKTAMKSRTDTNALLQTVSYETVVPSLDDSLPDETLPDEALPNDSLPDEALIARSHPQNSSPAFGTRLSQKAHTATKFIGEGAKATVGVLLVGVFLIAESMLGLDDDSDDDVSTSRGKADQNLKQWTHQRDNW